MPLKHKILIAALVVNTALLVVLLFYRFAS